MFSSKLFMRIENYIMHLRYLANSGPIKFPLLTKRLKITKIFIYAMLFNVELKD